MEKYFKLQNGVPIPSLGFGTWQIPDGDETYNAVKEALSAGYRHIDTAAAYKNEKSVGKAVKDSGIKREEIFVTSKLWNKDRGYESTLKAFEKTMKNLELEYLDLYLIHWPAAKGDDWKEINADTWRAMEELYHAGKIKAIGVSNFLKHHLEALMEKAKITPLVNQIEFHPGQMQKETYDFCQQKNIQVEAWSPLGSGKMLKNEHLMKIAEKYGKSVAQVCIRWSLQNNVLPLPKSVTPERIKQNREVFDFTLDEKDMKAINDMPYSGGSGLDPDKVNF